MQLNARVTNYILSTLSPDTTTWLFKEYKRFEDAHDLWATLKNEFACKAQEQDITQVKDSEVESRSLCESFEDKENQKEQMRLLSLRSPDYPVTITGLSDGSSEAAASEEEQRFRPNEESCSPVCNSTISLPQMCFMAKSCKEESENESDESESDEEEGDHEINDEDLNFGKLSKPDQQRMLKLVKIIAKQKHTLEKQEDLLIKKIEDLKEAREEKEELELKITNLNL